MSVAVAEPTKDVEDQDAVLHGLAKVAEGVRHCLHLAAELSNNKVTLHEGVEARIEPQSPGLGVVQKLTFECQLGLARVDGVADEVVKVEGDRLEDPGKYEAVNAQPRRSLDRGRGIDEDVVVEGVAPEGEEDQVSPTGVGRRLRVEDDQDEQSDVLNTPGLVVKLRHEGIGRIMLDDRGGGGTVARRAGGGFQRRGRLEGRGAAPPRRSDGLVHQRHRARAPKRGQPLGPASVPLRQLPEQRRARQRVRSRGGWCTGVALVGRGRSRHPH